MKKLFAVALSAVLATGLVSCGENKSKKDFDYLNDKGEIIWNTGYLTVTFEDYDEKIPLAPTIKLKAENKSDKHTSLFTSDFYVNDRCISVLSAEGIESGETAELELQIPSGEILYDNDGLQISALLDDKNFINGYTLPIYIKNDSKDSLVTLDKMKI